MLSILHITFIGISLIQDNNLTSTVNWRKNNRNQLEKMLISERSLLNKVSKLLATNCTVKRNCNITVDYLYYFTENLDFPKLMAFFCKCRLTKYIMGSNMRICSLHYWLTWKLFLPLFFRNGCVALLCETILIFMFYDKSVKWNVMLK